MAAACRRVPIIVTRHIAIFKCFSNIHYSYRVRAGFKRTNMILRDVILTSFTGWMIVPLLAAETIILALVDV